MFLRNDSTTNDNQIFHNNFTDNTEQTRIRDPCTNIWDNGYPSGGNYWSDYTGVDSDSDGIGDTPYIIDETNQDNYPLMEPMEMPRVEDMEAYVEYLDEEIQDLPDELLTRTEEDDITDIKDDFSDLFADTLENIQEGNYERAIDKLNRIKNKIFEEMVESAERAELLSLIDNLIAHLETII